MSESKSGQKSAPQVLIGRAYNKKSEQELVQDEDEDFHVKVVEADDLVDSSEKNILLDPKTGEIPGSQRMKKECVKCQKTFCSSFTLNEHIKVIHDNLKDKCCHICDYKTARRSSLLSHVRKVHEKWKPYKCSEEYCNFTAYHLYKVNSHINLVHKKVRPYVCQFENCVYSSTNKSGLNLHVKRVHQKAKTFHCQYCDYKTNQNYLILQHNNSQHLRIKGFNCLSCGFEASSRGVITNHFKRVHQGIVREKIYNHACDYCDYKTDNNLHLKDHVNNVHLNFKQFRCQVCQFECSSKSSMKRHLIIHTGKKDFACHHCNYKTSRRPHLNEHIANVHNKSFSFLCQHCDYKTSSNQRLQKHNRQKHKKTGENLSNSNLVPDTNNQLNIFTLIEDDRKDESISNLMMTNDVNTTIISSDEVILKETDNSVILQI